MNVATDFYGWSFLQFRGNSNIAIIHTAQFLKGKGCKRHYTRCSGVGGNIFGDVEMAGQSDDTINLSTNGFQ